MDGGWAGEVASVAGIHDGSRSTEDRDVDAAPSRAWPIRLREFICVGGLTPFLFALSWGLRRRFGLDAPEYTVGFLFFYGAYLVNDPHFAVTYLLFYRRARARAFGDELSRSQRIRYLLVGAALPVVLATWALVGLAARTTAPLSYLVQLMFLLVGWHYVKQGFGVLTVLAARRGVRWTPRERTVLLLHCYAGWAYAWASPADLGTEVVEKGVVYTTFPHGAGLERLTHVLFLSTIVPLAWVLVEKRRREGRLPVFTPLVAFLCSIWSWTIYTSVDPLVRYMTPALHSLQYLYFVWLLRGNEARAEEGPPLFGRSATVRLGWLALSSVALGAVFFHIAPTMLDDTLVPHGRGKPLPLGPTPYFAALYAIVNVHHYFMDFVIWRRDNPDTRYLQEPATVSSTSPST